MSTKRKCVLLALIGLTLDGSLSGEESKAYPALAASALPEPLRAVGIEQRLDKPVPLDLPFRDEDGKSVRLGDYFGERPVILALVYYQCPMLCNEVLNGLAKCLRVLSFTPGKEFEVVAVSFNPAEGPALARQKKAAYVKASGEAGTAAGWHFLTGDSPSIDRLTQAVGFHYTFDPETRQYAHAGGIMVLTPQGKLSRYFYGIEFPPRDVRLGLIEASKNKIGTLTDQLLLFCYHYDPVQGRYGLAIIGSLRILGIGFLVILGGLIARLLKKERKQRRAAGAGEGSIISGRCHG